MFFFSIWVGYNEYEIESELSLLITSDKYV